MSYYFWLGREGESRTINPLPLFVTWGEKHIIPRNKRIEADGFITVHPKLNNPS